MHGGKIRNTAKHPDVVEAVDRCERFFVLDMVGTQARRSWAGGCRYSVARMNTDWDQLLRRFNYWHDMQVTAMRKPTFAERAAAATSFKSASDKYVDTLTRRGKWSFLKPDAGDALFMIGFCTFTELRHGQDMDTMRFRLAEVAVALAACKAEKGEYPERLGELVPEYLKRLPQDICAEGPLTYRGIGKGYLLYSIGKNMRDDGGEDDDIAVRAE